MNKYLQEKDKVYLDKFEYHIQQFRVDLNKYLLEFEHLKTNKLIHELHQYCLLQKSDIENQLTQNLKPKFNQSKYNAELINLLEEFAPNIFTQFKTAIDDYNSRYVEMFIKNGLLSFGERLYRMKEIIRNNDSYKIEEKRIATEFLTLFNSYFQETDKMDTYLDLFAHYFAIDFYETKIRKKTLSFHDYTVSNKELLLFILDEIEAPTNIGKEIKLADKDYVLLMLLLEEQNLITRLITLNQKHTVLNGIIPHKSNSNINSTINNHYNSVSLKEYLNQKNNFNRREFIADKLRIIADKLVNIDN